MLVPPLSLALAGLEPDRLGATPGTRGLIEWGARAGFRAVQLDATAPDTRPRDLDRSGRRDLAALLRRHDLVLSGIDLWIPPGHFADPARIDRAVSAATAALQVAADVASLVRGHGVASSRRTESGLMVAVTLPPEPPAAVRAALIDAAERVGVRLADHAYPQPASPGVSGDRSPWLGVGIDPAALLLTGADPAGAAARAGDALAGARLTDAAPPRPRVAPGAPGGRLDIQAYIVALLAARYPGHAVLDLGGLPDPPAAAAAAQRAWGVSGF
ncbi:MAG TPA: TIM barrel protein [Phycisphaerales bacterium]|nr:TIM barrel protein [Phycisphaerales bacterium]